MFVPGSMRSSSPNRHARPRGEMGKGSHSWQEPLPTRLVGEVPNNPVKKSSVPSECGGQRSDVTKPTDQISCQRV